jgi:hypothetical protein
MGRLFEKEKKKKLTCKPTNKTSTSADNLRKLEQLLFFSG